MEAKVSVLYDVLNEIPLGGNIYKARTNDIKAAAEQLKTLEPGDIVMADRGYCSYAFFSEMRAKNADFIIRVRD